MAQALTTTFTPPSSCFDAPWTSAAGETGIVVLYRQNNDACRPDGGVNGDVAYSPGICPSGFSTAKATIVSGTETEAVCCPTGYLADGDGLCSSVNHAQETIACMYTAGVTAGPCAEATVAPSAVFVQNNIHVMYRQQDLPLFPAGYTPGPISTSPSSSTGHHGLATGVVAGLSIALALLVMLQAAVIYYMCFVRRRQRRAREAMIAEHGTADLEEDVEAKARAKAKELELENDA